MPNIKTKEKWEERFDKKMGKLLFKDNGFIANPAIISFIKKELQAEQERVIGEIDKALEEELFNHPETIASRDYQEGFEDAWEQALKELKNKLK